ncbi:hypothetical protein [Capnocytophaga sputigena]|jgi:hypothetical protein|uniref:hypothetical protein n=1 Tax=Capnocytophaga sputigena TaxID=1019 RepID=UPI0028D50E6E|nr:hypothetical protein [Capnocytophaga sputigena]
MEQQLDLFEENNDYIVRKNKKITLPLHNPNEIKKMESQSKVVKTYKEIPPCPQNDMLRFGNDFVSEFFLGEGAVELSINALRIVFNIISQLRNEQFQQKTNPIQLSLFEEEFGKEDNLFAKMSIKNNLITTNTDELKKAYKFLAQYKYDYYKFTTSEGEEVEALGGLIDRVLHNRTKGYTTFEISSYWLKRLLQIDNYNKTLYNLVYNVRSNKHILFSFWLSKIPMEGTQIKLDTLKKLFGVNYPKASTKDVCARFLKPIRENLDKYSDKSFNYNYFGDLITIKPYKTQYVEAKATNSEETKEEIKKNYKLQYFKDRHQLNDEHLKKIKYYEKDKISMEIIYKAYEFFVDECRKNKTKTTSYIGYDFLIELQKYIPIAYEKRYSSSNNAKKLGWRCAIEVY